MHSVHVLGFHLVICRMEGCTAMGERAPKEGNGVFPRVDAALRSAKSPASHARPLHFYGDEMKVMRRAACAERAQVPLRLLKGNP